jgi:hypothetical protein
MPGLILNPLLIGGGVLWVFGPSWAWIPINGLVVLLTALVLLVGGPRVLMTRTQMAALSVSTTYLLTNLLTIAMGVAFLIQGRYRDLAFGVVLFLVSGYMWGRFSGGVSEDFTPDYVVNGEVDRDPSLALAMAVNDFFFARGFVPDEVQSTEEVLVYQLVGQPDTQLSLRVQELLTSGNHLTDLLEKRVREALRNAVEVKDR